VKIPAGAWPSPTRAKAHTKVDCDPKQVRNVLRRLLGPGATLGDAAHLVGALDDAAVQVGLARDGEQIHVSVQHPDFEFWERRIGKDPSGRLYIWNEKIRIETSRQGKGLGSRVLRSQVENAYAFGIAYLACHAARVNAARPERPFSGYLVWPARGYDQSLDELANGPDNADEVREGTPAAFPEMAEAIRRRFGNEVRSILDLMSKVDGPSWWQEHGVELYRAVFDLSAVSRSLQVLNDYFLAPSRGGTPLCLKNPT
jgi:GNAT superfamily N-acetyltransferase